MTKNRKWSDADRALLVAEFRKGATYGAIAAMFGRTKDQISSTIQWLRGKGVDLPHRRVGLDVDALNKL